MKHIFLLFFFFSLTANATDFDTNVYIITDNIGEKILDIIVDDTLETDSVTIHTDTAKHRKKFTKCWDKIVYDGQGFPKVRVVCY